MKTKVIDMSSFNFIQTSSDEFFCFLLQLLAQYHNAFGCVPDLRRCLVVLRVQSIHGLIELGKCLVQLKGETCVLVLHDGDLTRLVILGLVHSRFLLLVWRRRRQCSFVRRRCAITKMYELDI